MSEGPAAMPRLVLDASVFLRSVFEDERGHDQALALVRDHALGLVQLIAPSLLPYEVVNGVVQALRGKRPTRQLEVEEARRILVALEALRISLKPLAPPELLQVAQAHERTAYDAAYVALAEREEVPLITGDKRLYRGIRARFPAVIWVEDYRPLAPEIEARS
ncbi:MAG TPA: PIN domain-containing protein [Candidatus Fraserbacteria bacterium]|nr:PIN domain-containing protein [Candidatus Fraserbacteria bacterium]